MEGNGVFAGPGEPLADSQPLAYEFIAGTGTQAMLLICDHASNHIPTRYARLGLSDHDLNDHIALDIGAGALTRDLSRRLGAAAVLAGTSRLVIDGNRVPGDPASILEVSHGVPIPGNAAISQAEAQNRVDRYFQPYHSRIAEEFERIEDDHAAALISIHSFTPYLDEARPWHLGVLWDRDRRLSEPMLAALTGQADLLVGANQPYSGSTPLGYSCQTHGDAAGRPNVLFEVRQDLIDGPEDVRTMAAILAPVIEEVVAARQPFARVPHPEE